MASRLLFFAFSSTRESPNNQNASQDIDEFIPQEEETRKTESPNKAPEEEKSNEQDAEEEEKEEEVEDNTNNAKTTKSKARCQGRYWPVPEHVRELGYLVAPFIGLKEFWDDLKDKREDRLPKKGSVHPIMHVMRALMGQRADSDGKPVWKGRTDYPSDVQRLTVAVLQGEFGFTLKGARDVISIRRARCTARQQRSARTLRLAECYKTGAGVPEDATKALKWYTKAADRGHAEAQYELAEHYWYGSGDAPYRPAEQGNPGAQFSLGVSYASGMGVGQDDAKAVECFRLETEQEHALARYFLANWL
eukprot:g64172.t1